MFDSHRRIFSGKHSLQAEPFCPYLTDSSGYVSLQRKLDTTFTRPGQPQSARPSIRGGKLHT